MANENDPPIFKRLNEILLHDNFVNKGPVFKQKLSCENVTENQNDQQAYEQVKVPLNETSISSINRSSLQQKQCSLLRAKAYFHMSQMNFEQAAVSLEEIQSLDIDAGWDTNLLSADCFLRLGREKSANKAINDMKETLFTPPLLDVTEVINLANYFAESSFLIQAIILYRVAADIYQSTPHTDNALLEGIYDCISNLHKVLTNMIPMGDRMRSVAIEYGIKYINEMLEALRSVPNIYNEKKLLMEAWCTNWIGFDYGLAGEHTKSVSIRKQGAELLKRNFGGNAMKYRVYGTLLHNIGVGQFNLDRFLEAKGSYSVAIAAKQAALDYESEEEKRDDIELSEKYLKDTLEKLS